MQERYDSRSLEVFLREEISADNPLMASNVQLVGFLLDRPIVGLTMASWTDKIWTSDEVRNVVADRGIASVLLFPDLYDNSFSGNINRPFFSALKEGRTPDWLQVSLSEDCVRLYTVNVTSFNYNRKDTVRSLDTR